MLPTPIASGGMRAGPSVSVVLPALDEAANIGHVLAGLPAVDEVIVVDGGSSDDTVEVARRTRPGTHVLRQSRSGKGNALACGIAASRGDIVILMNADGSCDPGDLPRFVQALTAGAQAAQGSRFRARGGDLASGGLERWADRSLTRSVNDAFGSRYTDIASGYLGFWRTTLDGMDLPPTNLPDLPPGTRTWGDGPEVDAVIAVRMAARGLSVAEIATVRYPRITGPRKRRGLVTQLWRGRRVLRWERRRQARLDRTTPPAYAHSTLRVVGEGTTGKHARPEQPPARRPYPGPRPDWAASVGQHRTGDNLIGNRTGGRRRGGNESGAHRLDGTGKIRRSGIYESGVHRAGDDEPRRSGLYDTGVHRTGVYDTGVHRTEVYDTGEHLLPERLPREVGGGRRRLDANDRRTR